MKRALKSKLVKFTFLVLLSFVSFKIQCDSPEQIVDRTISACKQTNLRKPYSAEIKQFCENPGNKLATIDQLLTKKELKEYMIEALVELFLNTNNQDSLCQFVESLYYVHQRGIQLPVYNPFMNELLSIKNCNDMAQARRVIEKFVTKGPEPLTSNINMMLKRQNRSLLTLVTVLKERVTRNKK